MADCALVKSGQIAEPLEATDVELFSYIARAAFTFHLIHN